jgi:DNA-binding GntR family transcriptional regulator
LVARVLTEEQRKKLSRNMRMQELLIEDDDIAGFYQSDEEFHHLLLDFTGFSRLPDIAQTVSLQVTRARILLLPTPGRIAETLAEHRAVFDAIANRDPDAAHAAMHKHLRQLMPRIDQLLIERPELFNLPPADAKE